MATGDKIRAAIARQLATDGMKQEDADILLWYLSACKSGSQWAAFTRVTFALPGWSAHNRRQYWPSEALRFLAKGMPQGNTEEGTKP